MIWIDGVRLADDDVRDLVALLLRMSTYPYVQAAEVINRALVNGDDVVALTDSYRAAVLSVLETHRLQGLEALRVHLERGL